MRGWLRLLILLSAIWTIVVFAIQYTRLPDENAIRIEHLSQTYDSFGLAGKIKDVETMCEKKSEEIQNKEDSYLFYRECLNANNRDGMKSNLEVHRQDHVAGLDQFVKDKMKELYVALGLQTLLMWLVPIFSVVFIGLGFRWVAKGFSS